MVKLARANRAFLGRVVRFLAGEARIRQFLDIGTGIPAAGNTHQVAQEVAPDSRVVYVDYDPVVLAHAASDIEPDKVTDLQARVNQLSYQRYVAKIDRDHEEWSARAGWAAFWPHMPPPGGWFIVVRRGGG